MSDHVHNARQKAELLRDAARCCNPIARQVLEECAQRYEAEDRARQPLSLPQTDHEMLVYLDMQLGFQQWNCPRCGWAEETSTMDVATELREYLTQETTP